MIVHRHWFHGPQDVRYHPCVKGEAGECYRVLLGEGRDCGGEAGSHERMTLTGDGPKRRAKAGA